MAKGWQARRRKRMAARRDENFKRREQRKDNKNRRRMERRQQRIDGRFSRLDRRQQGKTDRTQIRADRRVAVVSQRQGARVEVAKERFDYKKEAVRNGQNPDQWISDVANASADAVGSVAGIWGGGKSRRSNLADVQVTEKATTGFNPLVIGGIILAALSGLFLAFRKKKNKSKF